MRVHAALVAMLVAGCVTAACGGPLLSGDSPPTSAGSSASLARPLSLPSFSTACPRASGHAVLPDVGLGLGPGPVWPVGFGATGTAPLGQSSDGVWHAVKVLWAAAPDYLGPVLVRGRRLDAPGVVHFSLDGNLAGPDELRLDDAPAAAERSWPSYTLVQAPGCYAYQIDGTRFSYSVVFEIEG